MIGIIDTRTTSRNKTWVRAAWKIPTNMNSYFIEIFPEEWMEGLYEKTTDGDWFINDKPQAVIEYWAIKYNQIGPDKNIRSHLTIEEDIAKFF